MKYRCHKCRNIFNYSDLSEDTTQRHKSPCCGSSYSALSAKLDKYLEKFLDVNNDLKYYEYEEKFSQTNA